MGFHFVLLFVLTSVAPSLNQAALSPEAYWKSVLPNTNMPKTVRNLLPPEKQGASTNAGKNDKNAGSKTVGVVYGGVYWGHPYVWVHPPYIWGPYPFLYGYAASEDQLRDNPNVALFFQNKDLHPGRKMNLHFIKTAAGAKFLPRHVADTIPFSSNKFSEILNKFSVKPNSVEAKIMKKTITECEEPAIEGEEKYCATSLEGMVDFSTSKLGKNVQVMATEVDRNESPQQEFTITQGVKMVGNETVICHGQNYVYPVFYCHETHSTLAYMVPLVGIDGTKAKAVAVCHTDTSKWNPKHLAFQVLKVEPGTVPICHFLPEDHIVWVAT